MGDVFVRIFGKLLERTFKISCHKAYFFFGISSIMFGRLLNVGKGSSLFIHETYQVISQMPACQIHFLDGMRKGKAFVNWNSGSHGIPRI